MEQQIKSTGQASGVYHEKVALFLHEQRCKVVVLLSNKVKAFMRTLSVKMVSDKVCAQAFAQPGMEKKPETWQPPQKVFNELSF